MRGINCPELNTPEGARAKQYVEKLLPADSTVVIKTHKCRADIYGRFVVDVLCAKGAAGAAGIIENGMYLNQELLDQGLAVRMAE